MSLAQGAMRLTPAGTGAAQRFSSLSRRGADEAVGVIEGWLQAGDAMSGATDETRNLVAGTGI
jgi:hypothetical protein